MEKIRSVTKGVFKELNPYVDDNSGRVPVFGFPLICYSPLHKDDKLSSRSTFRFADFVPPHHYSNLDDNQAGSKSKW
jgi:hypothetical protein